VIQAFLYLTLCSLRNRVARRFRRLRQPRYLAGLAAGLGYVYFAVVRNQLRAARQGGDLFANGAFAAVAPGIVVGWGLALWLIVVAAWFWPSGGPPMKFTGAEVQFLFTAPVARRQILHYKLLRSQLGVVFGVLIAALFSGAATAAASGRWTFLVGGLLLFSTLRLHFLGIAFSRESLRGGRSVPVRAWIPPAVTAVLSVLILAPFGVHARELWHLGAGAGWPPAFGPLLLQIARAQPAATGLWPFAALVAPIVSPPGRVFLAAAMSTLALLALNYWWVLQSDAVLAEAVVSAEKQRAGSSWRVPAPVARRAPFNLAPTGRPEIALAWKNLILLGRFASPRTLIWMLLPIAIMSVAFGSTGAGGALAWVALLFAGLVTVLGPHAMRNDLRHDMPRLAVLKTWPVGGTTLLVGELLGPAAVLSVLVWTSLAVALGLSTGRGWSWVSFADRAAFAVVAALAAPVLIGAQLLLQNAAVILFPGWIPSGGARPRGIEAMGQQMLMFAGSLLALAVGVLPAAAVSLLAGLVLYMLVGFAGLIAAGIPFAAVLLIESALLAVLLGRVLERTEPSQVEGDGT
jgi:ABC-2 type transport system permease protein